MLANKIFNIAFSLALIGAVFFVNYKCSKLALKFIGMNRRPHAKAFSIGGAAALSIAMLGTLPRIFLGDGKLIDNLQIISMIISVVIFVIVLFLLLSKE